MSSIAEQSLSIDQLETAHNAVFELPGASEYKELGIETLIEEVIYHLDSENMTRDIAHFLALSDVEEEKYFSSSEMRPFKSKIQFSKNQDERQKQFLTVGRYLDLAFSQASKKADLADPKSTSDTEKAVSRAQDNLLSFYEYSLENLVSPAVNNLTHRLNGIDPVDIRNGLLKNAQEKSSRTILKESTAVLSGLKEKPISEKTLHLDTYAAINSGKLNLITTFLENYQGIPLVREVLEKTREDRINDRALAVEMLQLTWQAVHYSMQMNMPLNRYLQMIGLPKTDIVPDRLEKFLQKPELSRELQMHLKAEALGALDYAREKRKPLSYKSILTHRAQQRGFPDTFAGQDELEEMAINAKQEIEEIFPILAEPSKKRKVETPRRIGATSRAGNFQYLNQQRQWASVRILNVWQNQDRFRENNAHERGGHELHSRVLEKRSLSSIQSDDSVPSDIWLYIPGYIKEEFALTVEDGMANIISEENGQSQDFTTEEKLNDHEWSDLFHALFFRRNAIFGLVQLAVRQSLEFRSPSETHKSLTKKETQYLTISINNKIRDWYQLGVPIQTSFQSLTNNLNPKDASDGLRYVAKNVLSQQSQEEKPIDMKTAFVNQYGKQWLKNSDARIVLLLLMAESAENQDINTYGQQVLAISPEEARTQLANWGIKAGKI